MIIKTRYNVGDKVKYKKVGKKRVQVTCPFCKGKEEVTDELGKVHRCGCDYGEMTYEEPGEEIVVTGVIEIRDFREFSKSDEGEVLYRMIEDRDRESKCIHLCDNWVKESEIIDKVED